MTDRSAYFKAYHAAHREERNAAQCVYYRANKDQYRKNNKIYKEKHRLTRKVSKVLKVPMKLARAMLDVDKRCG